MTLIYSSPHVVLLHGGSITPEGPSAMKRNMQKHNGLDGCAPCSPISVTGRQSCPFVFYSNGCFWLEVRKASCVCTMLMNQVCCCVCVCVYVYHDNGYHECGCVCTMRMYHVCTRLMYHACCCVCTMCVVVCLCVCTMLMHHVCCCVCVCSMLMHHVYYCVCVPC